MPEKNTENRSNYPATLKKIRETQDPVEALSLAVSILGPLYEDARGGSVKPTMMKGYLAELTDAVERARNKEGVYRKELDAKLRKITDLNSQMEEFIGKAKKSEQEAKEAHEMMMRQRKGQQAELDALDSRYRSEIDALKTSYDGKLEEHGKLIENLMSELDGKRKTIEDLNSKGIIVEGEKFKLEEKFKKVQTEAEQLNDDLNSSREKTKELEVKAQEYENIMQQIKRGEYVSQVALEAKETDAFEKGKIATRTQTVIDSVAPGSKYLEYEFLHIVSIPDDVLERTNVAVDSFTEVKDDLSRTKAEIGLKDGQIQQLQEEVRSLLSQVKNADKRLGDAVEREKYMKAMEQVVELSQQLAELKKNVPAGK